MIMRSHSPVWSCFIIKRGQCEQICSSKLKFSAPSACDVVGVLVFSVRIHGGERANFIATWLVFWYTGCARQGNLEKRNALMKATFRHKPWLS